MSVSCVDHLYSLLPTSVGVMNSCVPTSVGAMFSCVVYFMSFYRMLKDDSISVPAVLLPSCTDMVIVVFVWKGPTCAVHYSNFVIGH